ncbi:MAG: hypothetical protein COA85_11925 [Robiginitomaculum sp.]|nr:MAG: hypothetical protein COA85_11925 [Robiginitomaculum sp.]
MAHSMFNLAYLAALILAGQHGDGGKFKDLRISAPKDILAMPSPSFLLLAKAGHPRGQVDVLGVFWRYGVCL